MAKLPFIELANGLKIPILHEDRNVIAIDKPQGWMLAPVSWQNTGRNLFAALTSSVSAGDFWARSRNLKFIRFVHRLDAETSGVLLLVKAPGAVPAYTELFEDRKVRKVYLAVVRGVPEVVEWKCRLRLAPMQDRAGLMEINNAIGKDSETLFRVIDKRADRALVMCWPLTGRTHQIRLHLAAVGHPVWGDELYGKVPTTEEEKTGLKLGLRSIRLSYKDPFMAEQVDVAADVAAFVKLHGFDPGNKALAKTSSPEKALEHPKARLDETRRAEKETLQRQREARRAEGSARAFPSHETHREWRPEARERGQGYEDRPQRGKRLKPFGGPREFEGREGGYGRKPAGGRYPERREQAGGFKNRPPARPGHGRRPYGAQDDSARGGSGYSGARPGGFRGRTGGKPGYGRPYEERGGRRPFDKGRSFNRGPRAGDARGEGLQSRPGVFQSSARTGLKAGFQSSGYGQRAGRRPFRSAAGTGPSQGKFHGGRGFGGKPSPQHKGGKPAWGKKPAGRTVRKFSKTR